MSEKEEWMYQKRDVQKSVRSGQHGTGQDRTVEKNINGMESTNGDVDRLPRDQRVRTFPDINVLKLHASSTSYNPIVQQLSSILGN